METIHVFILNPAAGHSDRTDELRERISALCREKQLDFVILTTLHPGHASQLCSEFAASHPDSVCRFYSCGGDGTLNEVVTGAMDHENAQVACFACGTGNDYIKIFDRPDYFADMKRVISGSAHMMDVMRTEIDGSTRGAINICSAGVDARVADWASRNKRLFPFGGKLVYDVALVKTFFSRLSRSYKVFVDGESYDGEYAILVAASGRFYGGGYYAVPEAEPDDGKLDFLLIKKVGHIGLLKLIGKFQDGRHNEFAERTVYVRGHELCLECRSAEPINRDGEIIPGRSVKISLHPKKLAFIVPEGCSIIHNAQAYGSNRKKTEAKASREDKVSV